MGNTFYYIYIEKIGGRMKDRFKFRYLYQNKLREVIDLDFDNEYITVRTSPHETVSTGLELKNLMQCTGIADKNGKLIYEGDVLKNLLNGKKYKVAWVGCQASFELHQILSPSDEDYKKAQPIAIYFANGSFQRFQVLGNIYENPELLEVKND